MSIEYPDLVREALLEDMRAELPPDLDIDTHFNPPLSTAEKDVLPAADLDDGALAFD